MGGLVAAGALAEPAWADQPDPKTYFPLVLSSDLFAQPQPQRLVFALSHQVNGKIKFASGPSLTVRFRPMQGKAPAGPWTELQPTAFDRAGLPKGRGVYVVRTTFPTAGVYQVEARTNGQKVPFSLAVNSGPQTYVPGMQAPLAPSPTTTDALGVNPICTRDPACPLHTQSLSTVIGAGKPVAALFATPARCQSQYCAPVLDEFLDVVKSYGDKVVPVHTEIYQSLTSPNEIATVKAWNLPSEPWLFGIDASGVIQSRIDGAFGGAEMKALLDALTKQ